MLVKAQLPKVYKGLRELSERIEDEQNLESRTKKKNEYLYNIHNEKISNALAKQESEIKLSDEYLKEYLNFLNFEDYQSFRKQYLRVRKQLEKHYLDGMNFYFILPQSQKNKLKEEIETSLYPGQQLEYQVADFDDEKEWEKQSFNQLEKQIPICFVPPAFFKSSALRDFLKNKKANQLILVWLAERSSELEYFQEVIEPEKELRFYDTADDLCFLIQLLSSIELWYSNDENKSKKSKKYKKTVIKNEVGHNQGFVIGQLKSKHAPQIQNHYYGNQKHDDED
jgi:hypothetical protein